VSNPPSAALPVIDFPASLPVSARKGEIMRLIQDHQVVIVCGETGSGKTTQLPKIALMLGRGRMNARPGQQGKLIGHTQPRRIAASSVAKRLAEETRTPLGDVVGFKVRFQDRLAPTASVKLMTDGILLAETQTDPLLRAYDTLIIDEAHERSLNIDFLLGYLKQILPRRRDLKVIVTSATIDAERFARHFASAAGHPAPVIMVSGRTYPVEQRWRPFEETRDYGLNEAIADAADELWAGNAPGDILVFLPGEREIREAADHLRTHFSHQPLLRDAEVLPLFARLSQAEQDRVFESHGGRRIVLATNVAETSLTVPGVRYVIDSGTARVKRYSLRQKVEQLLVEPISQAAANQRAGRCGRVANGICIRLYDEAGFASRPAFTDPEILRSSLAGVILRMKALGLGDVEAFSFLEAPPRRAITDGYQLLLELGAVDEEHALTALGAELARLPLDPRVGRMILEARGRGALDEVLIIASALSVQDVRDRPLGLESQADQAQAKFDDEKSEFSGYLKLWKWLHDARGGRVAHTRRELAAQQGQGGKRPSQAVLPVAQRAAAATVPVEADAPAAHRLSNRQYEQLLRQNFVNLRRVREWRDVHTQLHTVVAEHRWKLNTAAADYEAVHLSMLAGLLGNVGCKADEDEHYNGARGIRFYRHPGAHLSKKPGRWIVAAELVETTRLFARGIAAIEPGWIEQVGTHLIKRQLLDPHWEKRGAEAVALERGTLYGLTVYANRRVPYARVDMAGARELLIREGLVAGEMPPELARRLPFLAANQKLVAKVEELEHKSRRQDVLVDDSLIFAFYDAKLPPEVVDGRGLEAWWREASRTDPLVLHLSRDELMRHEAAGITTRAFPATLRLGGVDCAASYLHEPGDPRDGVTVTVPLFVLNQVSEERCEWLVPGMLEPKVLALLKSLPQKPRARFVPLPESSRQIAEELGAPERFGRGGLVDVLLTLVRERTSLDVKRTDFKLDMLSAHLFMNLRVVDEHGRQLGMGRNLGALKAEWGGQARGAFQALAGLKLRAVEAPATSRHPSEGPKSVPSEPIETEKQPPAATKIVASAEGLGPVLGERYQNWAFGDWPELMEIRQPGRGGQTLVGYPALIDQRDAVTIEVFDEPELAAARHRAGLRRLFALQVREPLKYLERAIPDLQKMAVAYMALGTADELKEQIVAVALDRAFLQDPLPLNEVDFKRRAEEGRTRLTLIAQEVARQAGVVLADYQTAARKIKDTKGASEVTQDAQQQLQRLVGKRFLQDTPWTALQHLPRYLKAIVLRLEKLRADPARDAERMREARAQEQRFWRLVADRKGVLDTRMQELRWLLEELRVSFFAQELRTPQPVSVKRLEKVWAQMA